MAGAAPAQKFMEYRLLLFGFLKPLGDSINCVTEEASKGKRGVHKKVLLFFFYASKVYIMP